MNEVAPSRQCFYDRLGSDKTVGHRSYMVAFTSDGQFSLSVLYSAHFRVRKIQVDAIELW